MLGRAILRSRHLPCAITPIQPALPLAFNLRTYAKQHNKPRRTVPSEYTSSHPIQASRHGPTAFRPAGQPQAAPDHSNLQDEFATTSSSDANTSPQASSPSAIDPAKAQAQGNEPMKPLPDLTQGIPPSLEAEINNASPQSDSTSLNITEDPSQATLGGEGKGELPKSAYISSFERRRSRLFFWFYTITASLSISGILYLGRNWEDEEEERRHPGTPSGWGIMLFVNRARARLQGTMDYYTEPTFKKLLPDPDPIWERPYTLVLSLEDLLVHQEWSREHGWRMAKRPGVDYFLRYLSNYFELVIFTSVPAMSGELIIRKLDPYRIVMWPLFREATRYRNGQYIKDLSFLNRDPKKVIMIDTDPAHVKLQPENAILLKKWKGYSNDKELVSFIPFLEYTASMGFEDTREVLKSYEGEYIPALFAAREAKAREQFNKELAERRAKQKGRVGGSFLSKIVDVKPPSMAMEGMDQSFAEAFDQGKMFQDQVRERGQKAYEFMEQQIRENGEKWLNEWAAEEEKAKEEAMKGMAKNPFAFLGAGRPQPPPESH